MNARAIFIGNSDGIGLAATKRLLEKGWEIVGVSRSGSDISSEHYKHFIADVSGSGFPGLVERIAGEGPIDLCVYFAGTGEFLDTSDMSREAHVFDVNLTGMVRAASVLVPRMVERGSGHFIGISSLADELLSAEAPSYHASKAGFTIYLESLALAMRRTGVHVTNLRFGFVDTKMAKGDIRPLMMSVGKAVDHLEYCIRKKPVRHTAPKAAVPLIKFRKLMMGLERHVPRRPRVG